MCFHEWNNINTPYFVKKKKKGIHLIRLAGLAYLFIFFASSLAIHNNIGAYFFIFILLVCASSDIGGYIFGKTIGGKKLTKITFWIWQLILEQKIVLQKIYITRWLQLKKISIKLKHN